MRESVARTETMPKKGIKQLTSSPPPHKGTIATNDEGGVMEGMSRSRRRRYVQQIMSVQNSGGRSEELVISFSKADYEGV
ncbi:hypothetical protein CR513_01034, partial [Mucuna pruriens]